MYTVKNFFEPISAVLSVLTAFVNTVTSIFFSVEANAPEAQLEMVGVGLYQ